MENNEQHASFDPYPRASDIAPGEENPSEYADPVGGFQADVFSEANDDDLYSSHYALSSAYPRTIDLSSSSECLSINHGLIASYEPVPSPHNPFAFASDNTGRQAPSSAGDSSDDEPLNTPGTDDGSMAASPVDRCADSPELHSPNRRDDPESDSSCALSLRVNTGSGSNTEDEDEQLGLGAGCLYANLDVHETEAAAEDLMRLRLDSMTSAESAPRSSPLDDSPVPVVRHGSYTMSRMGASRSARRSLVAPYPPQMGSRWRDSRK